MHVRETRGIQTLLAGAILAIVAVICASLLFYSFVPSVAKKTTAKTSIPPPLIVSSRLIYEKSSGMYYLLLHIANPNPEYIIIRHILVEYCNGSVIKFLHVPRRNSTIVPIGEHTFGPSQAWANALNVTINPVYLNYEFIEYSTEEHKIMYAYFAHIVNITLNISNIDLLYNIINVIPTTTPSSPLGSFVVLPILNISLYLYVKSPLSSYYVPISMLDLILNYANGTIEGLKVTSFMRFIYKYLQSFTLQNLTSGEPPKTNETIYTDHVNLSDVHSIAIKIVSHYPLVKVGTNNVVLTEVYLYLNNKLVYSFEYYWNASVFESDYLMYVNMSVYVIKFPRVMTFRNVNINIGIALANATTSAIIARESIGIEAPSLLLLTENLTKYIENTILTTTVSNPPPQSVSIKYIEARSIHPLSYVPTVNGIAYSYAGLTIRGTLYNYTDIIGPYEFKTIALEFTSNSLIPPNECYMIVIDTDKGPIIIRNNGFTVIS